MCEPAVPLVETQAAAIAHDFVGFLRRQKKFEENARGSLQEVHDHFNAKTVKGEIVIVVEGKN